MQATRKYRNLSLKMNLNLKDAAHGATNLFMHLKVQKVYFLRTVKMIEKNVRSHSMKSKRFLVQNTILQIKK